MWPVSSRFLDTVRRSHTVRARLDFLSEGEPIDGLDVLLTGGSVKVAEGTVRRTASITVDDPAGQLVPVIEKQLIIPGFSEIRLWAGVRYWDATAADEAAGTAEEYVPVFTGPITSYNLDDYPAVTLEASDRTWYVQRPFSTPYTLRAGDIVTAAITAILNLKVPPNLLLTNFPVTSVVTPQLLVFDEQSDPAEKIRDLGTALGWTVYADPMGVFVAADEPELSPDDVDMEYTTGRHGALIKPKLGGSVEGIVNTWIVSGESPTSSLVPPWAKVTDDDPTSPTFVAGSWSERPRFIHLPAISSAEGCLLAAQTYRKRERGIGDVVSADITPNPAHEKGDVLRVTGGLVDRFIIADSFDYDLRGSVMPVIGRTMYETGDVGG